MGQWSGNKTPKGNINGGQEYNAGDKVKTSDFNAAINNTIYASEFVDAMTAEVGSHTGSSSNPPTVSFDAQQKKFTFDYLKGEKGNTGDAAGFGTPTASASTLSAGSSATASVSTTEPSPDTAKIFNFTFGIPKGDTGENSLEMKQALPDSTSFVVGGTFTISNNKFNRLPVIGDTFNAIIYKTTDTSTYILGMEIQSVSGTYASGSSVAQIVYYNNLKGNTGAAATINNSTTKGLNMAVTTDNSNNILGLTITVTTV